MTEQTFQRLLVAFPDQSESFALGFEVGQLWQMMSSGQFSIVERVTHANNREVIRRVADHLGFSVTMIPSDVEGWDCTRLCKVRPERERPNPYGLRVV